MLGGALGGMFLQRLLPGHHLTKDTADVVRLGTGVIATMTALVVGLMIATAKGSFDLRDGEIRRMSADLILLDRQLVHYGAEAQEARELLRRYIAYTLDTTWREEASHAVDNPEGLLEQIQDILRAFEPADDARRWLKTRALEISGELAQTRWLLDVQQDGSLPPAFVAVVILWLTAIFLSFGLFAPRNTTVLVTFLLCSFSISLAVLLILEMDRPFDGLIHISSAPMREALARAAR